MPDTLCATLEEYVREVEIVRNGLAPDELMWFRGAGRKSHPLTPVLYRHPTIRTISELLEVERRLLLHFAQRAVPFSPRAESSDPWEQLFLMRHYGTPTRLMDWSESSFVGLWFALNSGEHNKDCAVWILKPVTLNRRVFAFQGYTGGVFSARDTQLGVYAPNAGPTLMPTAPVALYGTHNSPRIVAQRGVFTIAGTDLRPLNQIAAGMSCLSRMVIRAADRAHLLAQLRGAGFTESMIFPDLEGLGRELRTTEGFT